MNRYILPVLSAFALPLVSLPAMAGGIIHGKLTDASTKEPVAGVTVSLSAPDLSAPRSATTDEMGGYRFGDLPEGTYSVTTEASEYKPLTRNGIPLKGDRTLRINIPLLPNDPEK